MLRRSQPVFKNRIDAGRQLAEMLRPLLEQVESVVVLGLARGGMPVAAAVADQLSIPLDVLPVRKLGVPTQPELAIGAIAEGGAQVLNQDLIADIGIPRPELAGIIDRASVELRRLQVEIRGATEYSDLHGKTVVLVDDGLATGATMRAAIATTRTRNAARIIIAVPISAADTLAEIRPLVDRVVAVVTTQNLRSVGAWYGEFSAVTTSEVRHLLDSGGYPSG